MMEVQSIWWWDRPNFKFWRYPEYYKEHTALGEPVFYGLYLGIVEFSISKKRRPEQPGPEDPPHPLTNPLRGKDEKEMALEQLELETGLNKVEVAIALLKAWEPPEGYYLAFSGGKDSVAIYDLAQKAGVKFDAHYCVSPIDPQQVRDFIKQHYPDVIWDYHARGFWKMVDTKGLPMRRRRWCCEYIKEAGGDGRLVITGNRRAEGGKRREQCFIEHGRNKRNQSKTFIRPIINFDNYDIWQYIRENELAYCSLYDEGFERIGCVLCPFDRHIERSEVAFPKIVNLWKLACERAVRKFKERNYTTKTGKPMKHHFQTGEELYRWWVKRD